MTTRIEMTTIIERKGILGISQTECNKKKERGQREREKERATTKCPCKEKT
jgi:hypothetical protein